MKNPHKNLKLVLVDGNAILHRAFHALPPLTTKAGQPVNAVYGFTSMLFKVMADLKPTHLLVCFDRPEPTFRTQIFAGYQAQRPKMDEMLVSQVALVKKVLSAMKILTYELAGYEADDLIGTLVFQATGPVLPFPPEGSRRLKRRGARRRDPFQASHPSPREGWLNKETMKVIIVTGDRDILQLVDEQVKVYMPVKGLSEAKLYGPKEVKEKYGIKPAQIVDFKALVGDPSDNYPGVKGIGPKTASQLLGKFGTLEKIYEIIVKGRPFRKYHHFLNERLVKALSGGAEEAGRAKKLAKIVTDAPLTLDLKKARLTKLDKPEVRELFAKLDFKSLLKRLKVRELEKRKGEEEAKRKDRQLSLI